MLLVTSLKFITPGIKNKNIKKINGIPLVEHTIKFAKKIGNYFDILVSSNSNKVLKIAKKYKSIHTNFRPKRLCEDKSLTINVVKYELKRMEKKIIKNILQFFYCNQQFHLDKSKISNLL